MTTQTEALKLALEALEYASSRIEKVDFDFEPEITAIKEALAQPEQEPVGEVVDALHGAFKCSFTKVLPVGTKLYTTPPQRKPLTDWIDPNDKTQERFLPNIGEPVLFCHEGKTYYGKHNGGSFQHRGVFQQQYFSTWECHWMPLPAAHGIKEST